MECIYYKGKTGLTEKGQEHIFPAGLGGIKKLPKGYVSYEANNYFSKLEDHLMHGSLIMLHRSMFGPSKRKDKKEGKRIITVMENSNKDDSSKVELGFVREGRPYPITQVYITKDSMIFTGSVEGGVEELNSFIDKLKTENRRIIRKRSDLIKEKDIMIGYSQNTIYAGINPNNDVEDGALKALIEKAINLYSPNNQMKYTTGQISARYELSETMDDYRVFGKIAFNVLAEIKGKEYVLNSDFDKYRNWIMGNSVSEYDRFLPSLEENNIEKILPENCHWCILLNIQGDLCAVVCLYNKFKRFMIISKGRGCDVGTLDGMICDWKNEKEYRLIEYISHMTE